MRTWITKAVTGCSLALLAACNNTPGRFNQPLDTSRWPARFGFGRPATHAQIAALDIDVRPDGKGLPPGAGNAVEGRKIYHAKCAACHGTGTEPPDAELPAPALMNDSVGADYTKRRTIGNYWPYATTIFDYIRRTMPYHQPGSLTADEAYSLTAYLLYANKIIDLHNVIDPQTLPRVVMPAKELFIPDQRSGGPEIQ